MVRNKLKDLTNTLFAQLETLDDRDLTADELKIELQRSK
jgi:phage protein